MNKKILKKANLILIGIMFLDISISTTACGKLALALVQHHAQIIIPNPSHKKALQ